MKRNPVHLTKIGPLENEPIWCGKPRDRKGPWGKPTGRQENTTRITEEATCEACRWCWTISMLENLYRMNLSSINRK